MKNIIKWCAALAVIATLTGCVRTAPIQQINGSVSAGHTEAQVRTAILKAGMQREWVMTQAGPGVINGRLQARDHVAEIRITYSASNYSISYANSLNLQASGGKIHKSYNRWIRNLDKDIQLNLSAGAAL